LVCAARTRTRASSFIIPRARRKDVAHPTRLLLLRFYHQWLNAGATDIAPTLNAAQRWLREATAQELREWAMPLLPGAVRQFLVMSALARFEAHDKPFQSPYHWAAFCSRVMRSHTMLTSTALASTALSTSRTSKASKIWQS